MGRIIQFPCRDYYEVYEEYYSEDSYEESTVLVKDGLVKGFVRKCLMFILMRL